jgi:hypothetical protein
VRIFAIHAEIPIMKRGLRFGVLVTALCLTASFSVPSMATVKVAAPSWASTKGAQGQLLKVSQARKIPVKGATITIIGRGYDETVGIYIALCVKPKPQHKPTPCGGGVDKSGATGSSVWVSSNPPPYGVGLAIPFGVDGKFRITLKVGPHIGKQDCRRVSCAIVTRADHTNSEFRGADVLIPVTFTNK